MRHDTAMVKDYADDIDMMLVFVSCAVSLTFVQTCI